jgi:hypothetical protein
MPIRMNDKGASNLAAGVVQRALEDYHFYYWRLKKRQEKPSPKKDYNASMWPDPSYHDEALEEVRRFLLGRWFEMLSDLDGAELIRLIESRGPGRIVRQTPGKRQENSPQKGWGKRPKTGGGATPGGRYAQPGPDGKPRRGPAVKWDRIAMWPELREKLLRHRIMQKELCAEMGIHPTTLIGNMINGKEKTRRRMDEAADRIIERRKADGLGEERRRDLQPQEMAAEKDER